eukprot:366730_1
MFIFLVRSNRLNHPLITQPSEPINCAVYERYAKKCPYSWVIPPPKPLPPSSDDTAINMDVNMADDVDNGSDIDHDEEEKQNELMTFPGDASDHLVRNNSNNIIISNRNALEGTFQSLLPRLDSEWDDHAHQNTIEIESEYDEHGSISDIESDNVDSHPSDDDIINEMDVPPASQHGKEEMDEKTIQHTIRLQLTM